MKLELTNNNYCATLVRVQTLVPLEGMDNVVGFPIFGFQAIVGKETKVGELGVLFTAETQLSENYCKENNLYRDTILNKNPEEKGYLEENRRVKAIKFRGHRSSALFMPLRSLDYVCDTDKLKEGDTFNIVNGEEVCKKYVIRVSNPRENRIRNGKNVSPRVEPKLFPQHFDTENYFKNTEQYKENDYIYLSQKLHGTSGRFGNVIVNRKLTLRDKIAKFLGVKVQEKEYDYIAGSRQVVKDLKAMKEFNHYYDSDIWNEWLEKIKLQIPKDYILYGEIVGYIGDKPIQKGYTYCYEPGQSDLFIYRVTKMNPDGISVDLSWKQLKEFCTSAGLNHVPELWEGRYKDFIVDEWLNKNLAQEYIGPLPLAKESPCDEGVCIRIERLQPYVTKAKSPVFLEFETKQLDKQIVDIETIESNA